MATIPLCFEFFRCRVDVLQSWSSLSTISIAVFCLQNLICRILYFWKERRRGAYWFSYLKMPRLFEGDALCIKFNAIFSKERHGASLQVELSGVWILLLLFKLRAALFRVYTVWIVYDGFITFEGFITFVGSTKRFARHKSLWENGSVLKQAIRTN